MDAVLVVELAAGDGQIRLRRRHQMAGGGRELLVHGADVVEQRAVRALRIAHVEDLHQAVVGGRVGVVDHGQPPGALQLELLGRRIAERRQGQRRPLVLLAHCLQAGVDQPLHVVRLHLVAGEEAHHAGRALGVDEVLNVRLLLARIGHFTNRAGAAGARQPRSRQSIRYRCGNRHQARTGASGRLEVYEVSKSAIEASG